MSGAGIKLLIERAEFHLSHGILYPEENLTACALISSQIGILYLPSEVEMAITTRV